VKSECRGNSHTKYGNFLCEYFNLCEAKLKTYKSEGFESGHFSKGKMTVFEPIVVVGVLK